MFVYSKEICKLIKKAYKNGGVTIIRNKGYIIITTCTFYWELQVRVEELSNKIKSCIVELAGELPTEGNGFRIEKDVTMSRDVDMIEPDEAHPEEKKAEYIITKHVIEESGCFYRVIQDKATGRCTVASEVMAAIVDKALEKSDDTVEGPYISVYHSQRITWSNVTGAFNFMLPSYEENSDLAAGIKTLDATGLFL